jgi:hypothetical protein
LKVISLNLKVYNSTYMCQVKVKYLKECQLYFLTLNCLKAFEIFSFWWTTLAFSMQTFWNICLFPWNDLTAEGLTRRTSYLRKVKRRGFYSPSRTSRCFLEQKSFTLTAQYWLVLGKDSRVCLSAINSVSNDIHCF